MEASARSRHAQHARAQGAAFGVQAKCTLDGIDALRKRQQIDHVATREDQGHGVPRREVVA